MSSGPLAGVRVVELAGIGPGPFCGMLLGDLGAEVIRVERAGPTVPMGELDPRDLLTRNRSSIVVDLKKPEGTEVVLRLLEGADILIEGFRPGVTERLGLGPADCLARNPALIYGRMTGWGQEGPLAQAAGHDIDYIAVAGALEPLGRRGERPLPPLNLVGDFGGGGMLLGFGLLAALLNARATGVGQIVDAAMVDGASLLTTMFHEFRGRGMWADERGTNFLDTGAHFYEVYETSDALFVALGAIEPEFYDEFLRLVGLADADMPGQHDRAAWPAMKQRFAELFLTRTRSEWCALLEGTDACFAPVLSLGEAPMHEHAIARSSFVDVGGIVQPAPAPRFSGTPTGAPQPCPPLGADTDRLLVDVGFEQAEVEKLRELGAIR